MFSSRLSKHVNSADLAKSSYFPIPHYPHDSFSSTQEHIPWRLNHCKATFVCVVDEFYEKFELLAPNLRRGLDLLNVTKTTFGPGKRPYPCCSISSFCISPALRRSQSFWAPSAPSSYACFRSSIQTTL